MANPNVANVAVGKPKATGGVYAGSTSATLPGNATAALDSSLSGLGYAGEDGLVQTKSGTVTTIRAWGGDPVKVINTTDDLTYAFTLLELTQLSLSTVFGEDNVSWTDAFGGQKVTLNGNQVDPQAFVFDMLDGDTSIRIVVPNGQLDGQVTINFVDAQASGIPLNLIALPDSSGNKAYMYLTKFYS